MKVSQCTLIEPFICQDTDNIVDVAKHLRKTTLRHVFVVNKDKYPVGIISVLDINNRVVANNMDLAKTQAKDIMTQPITIFDADQDAKDVYINMLKGQHAMDAVVQNKKMIGIITLQELMCRVQVE